MFLYTDPRISVLQVHKARACFKLPLMMKKLKKDSFPYFHSTQALNHSCETLHHSINELVNLLRALHRIYKLILARHEIRSREAADGISLKQLIKCFHSRSGLEICTYSRRSAVFECHTNATDLSTITVSDICTDISVEANKPTFAWKT